MLVPIVGFVVGAILTNKGRHGHGPTVMVVAVLAVLAWTGLAVAGVFSAADSGFYSTYSDCLNSSTSYADCASMFGR